MHEDLNSLRIDRSGEAGAARRTGWRWLLLAFLVLLLLLSGGLAGYRVLNAAVVVSTVRARAEQHAGANAEAVVLNATGYVIAAHKIEVAAKVVGKVAWIGVEKGDKVREGQVIVRLEDDEYQAQLQQARGQLMNLEARLAEMLNGSRPEEVAAAQANVAQARADLDNARISLERTRTLAAEKIYARSALDDAQARYDAAAQRVNSLQKAFELVKIGPRKEQIDAVRGQIEQARGALAYTETLLRNTVIRAPVAGTILERVVERGEFVTTSFVGERGAKGYVVSLADLNDLRVELDISQNDFGRLRSKQKGTITLDAYPGRSWQGVIDEVAPEANRQKATVQVKVKVLNPDEYLRPEMNASVAFLGEPQAGAGTEGRPVVYIPAAAVRNDRVFVVVGERVVERAVRLSGNTPQGLRVESGLIGGEDLVENPPAELKDGAKVRRKEGAAK